MRSQIFKEDVLKNKDVRSNLEARGYYPVWVKDEMTGKNEFALFTERELKVAIERGSKNPEDVKDMKSPFARLISWILNGFSDF